MEEKTKINGTVYNPFCYDADDATLQKFLLTGIVVAGKRAEQQQVKLDAFLSALPNLPLGSTPLEQIAGWSVNEIHAALESVRMGQYGRIARALHCLANAPGLDLRTIDREDLVKRIPGIGRKTASFFILFSRKGAKVACLDTHILAFLAEKRLAKRVPAQTPSSRKGYLRLENAFLRFCESANAEPARVDFDIWKNRALGVELPDYLLAATRLPR